MSFFFSSTPTTTSTTTSAATASASAACASAAPATRSQSRPAAATAHPVINLTSTPLDDAAASASAHQNTSFWSALFGKRDSAASAAAAAAAAAEEARQVVRPNQKVMVVSEDSAGFLDVQLRAMSYAEMAALSHVREPAKYAAPKPAVQMSLDSVYGYPQTAALRDFEDDISDDLDASTGALPTIEAPAAPERLSPLHVTPNSIGRGSAHSKITLMRRDLKKLADAEKQEYMSL